MYSPPVVTVLTTGGHRTHHRWPLYSPPVATVLTTGTCAYFLSVTSRPGPPYSLTGTSASYSHCTLYSINEPPVVTVLAPVPYVTPYNVLTTGGRHRTLISFTGPLPYSDTDTDGRTYGHDHEYGDYRWWVSGHQR